MSKFVTILAAATLLTAVTPVGARGVLKGAAVGATAGHFVGHGHAKAGAVAGGIVGHHHAHMKAKAH